MRRNLSFLLILLFAAPAAAQPPRAPTAYDRAIAAGYKALTLCSAIFHGGRTQAQIEALELTGIYPEYDAIVPTLTANVDTGRGVVSVPYDPALPPRMATFGERRGCTIQPIGWAPLDGVTSTGPRPRSRPPLAWPMGDENAAAPGAQAPALARTVAAAFDGATFGANSRTTAVVVVRGGRIVGEHYADGFGIHTAQRTWSVAKSLAGTIIGAAAHRGLIDPAAPAGEDWPSMGDPRGAITLDQLMRMASGLHSATAGNRTDAVYFGGTAVNEETTGLPLEAVPGTRFRYANNDILLAVRALMLRLDMAQSEILPDALLFRRIGMRDTVAETDWMGNYILSSQVWSSARDLARFGLLYLNDGVWNGERILSEGWRAYVTRPSGPQPQGAFGYGATFWLLNRSEGVPADTFAAFGNRGQYVVIVPSRNLVIVRRGEDAPGGAFDVARFTAAVLEALQ